MAIYIRDSFRGSEIEFDYDVSIKCIALNVYLSPEMQFHILVLYNPSTCDTSFCDNLEKLLKVISHKTEVMIFGDFNINWSDKKTKKKLKSSMSKFDFSQLIKGPTRITRSTQSQIDLMFSNREERIVKTFNLITGLSDHNMILAARKLTKKRFANHSLPKANKLLIPKQDLTSLENELKGVTWNNVLQSNNPNICCNELINIIEKIICKFLKTLKNSNRKKSLPWLNASIRQLMKQRDLALKATLKSRTNTAMALYKGLQNRVIK